MATQAMNSTPPIDYPVVVVGGIALQLKLSLLSQYVLDDLGVDGRKLPELMAREGAGIVVLMFKLFSALVAHHYVALKQPVPAPEFWASQISPEEPEKFREICKAVYEALAKARPAGTSTAQTLPA
jgi:hypothetical protein